MSLALMDLTGGIIEIKTLNMINPSEYERTWAALSQMSYKKVC